MRAFALFLPFTLLACAFCLDCTIPSDVQYDCSAGKGQNARDLVTGASGNFTYDSKSFLLDGKVFQILGGQMDPQRVPREFWASRLEMAKSMGLNTIFSYIYWNEFESTQGQFNFTGINDIAAWYQEVQKAGLKAVLRPGPYVCGERDWGGFPHWLSQIDGMKVRANNQPFLKAVESYIKAIAGQLQSALVTQGGPILMIQVENEYGQYDSDHAYTNNLYTILKASFKGQFYTNDAGNQASIQNGQVPGVLAEIDGAMRSGFDARRQYVAASSGNPGPLLNGEYYTKWFTFWGPKSKFQTLAGDTSGTNAVLNDLDYCVSGGHSFSLYMFHGGTNFGFGNGAVNFGTGLQPFLQSYDYGAPLDESGRPNSLYQSIRQKLSQYVQNIPAVPSLPAPQSIASFTLKPVVGLFDSLPTAKASNTPLTMEQLGQGYGYVLYEHTATTAYSGNVSPGDSARDRVIVYVNGVRRGVIDAIYKSPASVNIQLKAGDKLWLLIENLGRVDYGNPILDQRKGVVGQVRVGNTVLSGTWNHYSLPLQKQPSSSPSTSKPVSSATGPPVWYYGSLANNRTGMAADTFLRLPGGIKGVVFVNGVNIGRYWTVGPQQQLYIPGAWLRQGDNDVWVLELEPTTAGRTAQGDTARIWANNPDPDCNNCS